MVGASVVVDAPDLGHDSDDLAVLGHLQDPGLSL